MADQLLSASDIDPVIPVLPALVWSGAAAVILGMTAIALVGLIRSSGPPGAAKVLWTIVIIGLPVVGAAAFAIAEAWARSRGPSGGDVQGSGPGHPH